MDMASMVDAKSQPWWQPRAATCSTSSISLLGDCISLPSIHPWGILMLGNATSGPQILVAFIFCSFLKIKVQHSRILVERYSILVVCVPCAGRFVARLVLHPAALPEQSLHNAEMLCLQ